jgi:hypothetical protein
MAAARNNLSRRAVLGAAFVAPVLLTAAEARPPRAAGRRRWDLALAAVHHAEAKAETFRVHYVHPADHAYHAIRDRWPMDYDFSADAEAQAALTAALAAHEPYEERLGDLVCAHSAAIKRLLLTPAPDLQALATKIALAVDHEVVELEGGDRCMAALKADALRIAAIRRTL